MQGGQRSRVTDDAVGMPTGWSLHSLATIAKTGTAAGAERFSAAEPPSGSGWWRPRSLEDTPYDSGIAAGGKAPPRRQARHVTTQVSRRHEEAGTQQAVADDASTESEEGGWGPSRTSQSTRRAVPTAADCRRRRRRATAWPSAAARWSKVGQRAVEGRSTVAVCGWPTVTGTTRAADATAIEGDEAAHPASHHHGRHRRRSAAQQPPCLSVRLCVRARAFRDRRGGASARWPPRCTRCRPA